jgi:hypothetical protein
MRIPNGARAVVELMKLTEYCLSSTHPRGRHKARVFALKLGFTPANAGVLRTLLLTEAATNDEAVLGVADVFGQRYVLDFLASGPAGRATLRSAWMVRAGEDVPRFASCYVL